MSAFQPSWLCLWFLAKASHVFERFIFSTELLFGALNECNMLKLLYGPELLGCPLACLLGTGWKGTIVCSANTGWCLFPRWLVLLLPFKQGGDGERESWLSTPESILLRIQSLCVYVCKLNYYFNWGNGRKRNSVEMGGRNRYQ